MNEWRHKLSIDIEDSDYNVYCVAFYREYEEYWGYMGMRDYRTYEPTNNFELRVVPYINGHADFSNCNLVSGSFGTKVFDKDMANKIWYNLKKLYMSYESLHNALAKEGLLVE